MSYRSAPVVLEHTGLYRLTSFGNGDAYSFERFGPIPAEVYVQGDGATELRAAYDDVKEAAATPGTIFHRATWDDCLALLWSIVSND